MPVLDQVQSAQLAERAGTHGEVLFWVTARNRVTGQPEQIGFWTGDDHQEFLVGGEVRTYFGAGSFIDLPPIQSGAGFQVRQHRIKLAPFTDEVRQLVRGYEPRMARVEIHVQPFDIYTGNPLGTPKRMVKGYISEAPEEIGVKGGESHQEIVIVSSARDLTQTLPLMRSGEELKKRNPADKFRDYADVTAEWSVPWGQQ